MSTLTFTQYPYGCSSYEDMGCAMHLQPERAGEPTLPPTLITYLQKKYDVQAMASVSVYQLKNETFESCLRRYEYISMNNYCSGISSV